MTVPSGIHPSYLTVNSHSSAPRRWSHCKATGSINESSSSEPSEARGNQGSPFRPALDCSSDASRRADDWMIILSNYRDYRALVCDLRVCGQSLQHLQNFGCHFGHIFSPLCQVELDPKNAVAHCNLGVVLGDHEAWDAPLWVGSMLKETIGKLGDH